jgi:hypothetical protein
MTSPPHQLLPSDAIAALQKAAQAAPSADRPDARQRAIEKTTERIKQQYPQLFKNEGIAP